MNIQTHIHHALASVQDEQIHVAGKQVAFDEFERNVQGIPADSTGSHAEAVQTTTGGAITATASRIIGGISSSEDRCHEVREVFAETIRPHSIEDTDEPESLLETIREELGGDLAVTLATQKGGRFTSTTKRAVLSASAERRQELMVMEQALDAEEDSLQSAIETVETTIDWLVEANETPLTDLDFDELQARHETLATHRTQCNQIAHDRQAFLNRTTSHEAAVGINHRTLTEYLYAELPVNYPVLVTSTRLDEICTGCQRMVRDHLVRRV